MSELPELHLAGWRATKDTLHLYCQIVGKIRLATTPPRNHWWNVPLYVDVRGLTTRRLHHSHATFEITLDSSITPWSCVPLTAGPGPSGLTAGCRSLTLTLACTPSCANSASTS